MIDTAHIHKALMIARLGYLSVFDNHDVIGMSDSIEPVCDDEQCLTLAKLRDCLLNVAFVVGINGTEEALEAIRTMKLDGSVYSDSEGQGEMIMEMAYALGRDEPFPPSVELTFDKYVFRPYSIITYDNVQKYLSSN